MQKCGIKAKLTNQSGLLLVFLPLLYYLLYDIKEIYGMTKTHGVNYYLSAVILFVIISQNIKI